MVIEIPETSLAQSGLFDRRVARSRPRDLTPIRLMLHFADGYIVQLSTPCFTSKEIETDGR
jgi:hypothetical protein